ncbi:MAG: PEP-CTERM sorting domain-containing protein [Cyanobacteria bacterium P01_H01_bin.130]
MKLSTITALTTAIATTTLSTLAIAPAANAFTLITNNAGRVTDIEDLYIDGYGTYDVTFQNGTFGDLFDPSLDPGTLGTDGLMGPTFWGDRIGAIAAAEAIAVALGTDKLLAAIPDTGPSSFSDRAIVPYRITNSNTLRLATDQFVNPDLDNILGGVGRPIDADSIPFVGAWAKFTLSDSGDPTPVPEPSALLGLGLAMGLSTLTRRRKPNQDIDA